MLAPAQAVLQSPVVVGFLATELFSEYDGGVWPASDCEGRFPTGAGGLPDDSRVLNHVRCSRSSRQRAGGCLCKLLRV